MDLGNVVPSWEKRYPFSIENSISISTTMKFSLITRDERSLNCIKISDSRRLRNVSAGFDKLNETYSRIYEFELASKATERIILVFSSNEDDEAGLYHDVWLNMAPKLGKFVSIYIYILGYHFSHHFLHRFCPT
jgi:hypothetical protein